MTHLMHLLRRFRREEDGNATIEFAILFPFFIFMFCAAVELGMITFRHSMLERGLDLAVRDVRLSTATNHQHADLKEMICDYAGFLPDCETQLFLQMDSLDMFAYTPLLWRAACFDVTETANPARSFRNGQQNQMMVLRACYTFRPVFPLTGLGRHLEWRRGEAWMIATSAFVQEPI